MPEKASDAVVALRGKLFGRKFKVRPVSIDIDGEPVQFGVRAPSIRERAKILEVGRIGPDGAKDIAALTEMKLEAVLCCAVHPESHEQLFTNLDRENLRKESSGGWVDKLADECVSALKGEDPEEVKGN